jgi:hypothetical protein
MSVINFANNSLTTPALSDCVSHFPDKVPADVRAYLKEIFERNLLRNDRLSAQLFEAISALNSVGITPTLLKGAAMLASVHPSKKGNRIMADLDILVAPEEIKSALNCLFHLGYRVDSGAPDDPNIHFVVVERSKDVGQIDLHRKPPGPDFFYHAAGPIIDHCKPFVWEGIKANLPSSTYHALILICHDQFHDDDYRAARVDLRHLLDLRELINSSDGIDWDLVASLPNNSFVRNGIETHLVTLHKLLGAEVPLKFCKHLVPRFQSWRRSQQISIPSSRFVLSVIALLIDCPGYLKYRGQNYRSELDNSVQSGTKLYLPTWAGLMWMFYHRYLSKEQTAGKL